MTSKNDYNPEHCVVIPRHCPLCITRSHFSEEAKLERKRKAERESGKVTKIFFRQFEDLRHDDL